MHNSGSKPRGLLSGSSVVAEHHNGRKMEGGSGETGKCGRSVKVVGSLEAFDDPVEEPEFEAMQLKTSV